MKLNVSILKHGHNWIKTIILSRENDYFSLNFSRGVTATYPGEHTPLDVASQSAKPIAYIQFFRKIVYIAGLTEYFSIAGLPSINYKDDLARVGFDIYQKINWDSVKHCSMFVYKEEPMFNARIIRGRPLIRVWKQYGLETWTYFNADEEGIKNFLEFAGGDSLQLKQTIADLLKANCKGLISDDVCRGEGRASIIDGEEITELRNAYYKLK